MLCDLNCSNLKCIGTGNCINVPTVESPNVTSGLYCGPECECAANNADPTACAGKMPDDAMAAVTLDIEKGQPGLNDFGCNSCTGPCSYRDGGYCFQTETISAIFPYNDGTTSARQRLIDADSATRKTYPMAMGLLDYFPDALAEVSKISYLGNQKHNPGEPMHHARGKSTDHADCILRHLVGRGGFDGELRESAALAWRALALLQEELEREMNLSLPRGARAPA